MITWNYDLHGSGYLRVRGTVTSTRTSCAEARVHTQELLVSTPRAYDKNHDGYPDYFPDPIADGTEYSFLLKRVCGLNKKLGFNRDWAVQRSGGYTKIWTEIWLRVKVNGVGSSWN